MKLLIAAFALLSSCEFYRGTHEGVAFTYFSTNDRGLVPNEDVTVTGALASVTNSNAQGGRTIANTEAQQETRVQFPDGAYIAGPVTSSTSLNSIAAIIRNIVIPKAVRDIWVSIVGEAGETTRTLNQ